MDYNEILIQARKNIGPNCKACPVCNGLACANTIPGPGSKAPGNGAHENWSAWQRIRLNMDTIADNTPADTATQLFGQSLSMPLLTGPVGSIETQFNPEYKIVDYNRAVIAACDKAGILDTYGDGLTPEVIPEALAAGSAHRGRAIPILNPAADEDIMRLLDSVNEARPVAAGIVIDSAGLPHLKKVNAKAGAKTVEQLKMLKEYCKVPLIMKGVMTVAGAQKAVEAGADAIVVSNHGGRVLAHTPATAEVLPEIARAVKGKTKIIVDGGIRTGLDLFKAIALGADAAMICRPFIVCFHGGGEEAVSMYIEKVRAELADTMFMCGARKIADINSDMIYTKGLNV